MSEELRDQPWSDEGLAIMTRLSKAILVSAAFLTGALGANAEPANSALLDDAKSFMKSYATDLQTGNREAVANRYDARGAYFVGQGTSLSRPDDPNDLWCADYKGEFMLADRRYCYPLTVTDFASRYLLCCEALETTKERYAFTVFERAFKDFGLPRAIRSDNGVPFASNTAFFGLSKLSVWWLRLGIAIERIKPGNPQQNGRHERMHLTLKNEATKPPGKNFLQQQAKFDRFIECYNQERPHQAIGMRYPAELYKPSPRPYAGLQELHYPFHDMTVTVTQCGRLCFGKRKINLSGVFAGQNVGVREVADHVWLISFMHYDLGFFDDQCNRVECAPNPFSANVSAMSPV